PDLDLRPDLDPDLLGISGLWGISDPDPDPDLLTLTGRTLDPDPGS
ncbi:hypothetical protein LSM04_007186, partial [Trypanosoma melophagium]